MHRHSAVRVQETARAPEGGEAESHATVNAPARRPALRIAATRPGREDQEDGSACAAHWAY